jgi:hypothetical protein
MVADNPVRIVETEISTENADGLGKRNPLNIGSCAPVDSHLNIGVHLIPGLIT